MEHHLRKLRSVRNGGGPLGRQSFWEKRIQTEEKARSTGLAEKGKKKTGGRN